MLILPFLPYLSIYTSPFPFSSSPAFPFLLTWFSALAREGGLGYPPVDGVVDARLTRHSLSQPVELFILRCSFMVCAPCDSLVALGAEGKEEKEIVGMQG